MAIYTIKKVRDKKNGNVKDRESRRKGHRVSIENVELGVPLIATYVEEGTYFKTSEVEAFNANFKTDKSLIVQTNNSVYVFSKEDE